MRRKIAAGNWKMNLSPSEAVDLLKEIEKSSALKNADAMYIFPPSIYIDKLISLGSGVRVGTQNFHPAAKGAFTGEVSVQQFKAIGVDLFLVGHSERREIFGEDHSFIKQKVDAALEIGGEVVFCCGEPLSVREAGEELSFVKKQLLESLFHLSSENIKKCVIAYEPVWAIGTGKTATIEQAEEMHAAIRSWVKDTYGDSVAEEISILYGGSCNPGNAKELFACKNVDGGLIGGASLEAESFLKIAASF